MRPGRGAGLLGLDLLDLSLAGPGPSKEKARANSYDTGHNGESQCSGLEVSGEFRAVIVERVFHGKWQHGLGEVEGAPRPQAAVPLRQTPFGSARPARTRPSA